MEPDQVKVKNASHFFGVQYNKGFYVNLCMHTCKLSKNSVTNTK